MPSRHRTFGGTKIHTFDRKADMHEMLQQAVSNAEAMGPAVLLQGMQIERPIDVVKATALTARQADHPGCMGLGFLRGRFEAVVPPYSRNTGVGFLDEVQAALQELDRRYGF